MEAGAAGTGGRKKGRANGQFWMRKGLRAGCQRLPKKPLFDPIGADCRGLAAERETCIKWPVYMGFIGVLSGARGRD